MTYQRGWATDDAGMRSGMRVVVTGATGNVGSRLIPALLAHSAVTSVVGIARRLPKEPDARAQWVAADVAAADLAPLFRGADVVIHLAWLLQPAHDPAEMERVNIGGTRRVLAAVVGQDVPALVHASSIGAYSPGPNDAPVSESHPTGGIATSTYSRHKAQAEQMLDELQGEHPALRIVRLRPGVVLQADAASELARYFLGPFVPQSLVRTALLPVIPNIADLAVQALHADDMARAYVLAATSPVSGAFNIASAPVLTPAVLAQRLNARLVPFPAALARAAVSASWRLHLQPPDPGWVDIARLGPVMDIGRAHTVLGWQPTVRADDALVEVLDAMGQGRGGHSPVMRPRASLPGRLLEVARAVVPGARGTG